MIFLLMRLLARSRTIDSPWLHSLPLRIASLGACPRCLPFSNAVAMGRPWTHNAPRAWRYFRMSKLLGVGRVFVLKAVLYRFKESMFHFFCATSRTNILALVVSYSWPPGHVYVQPVAHFSSLVFQCYQCDATPELGWLVYCHTSY